MITNRTSLFVIESRAGEKDDVVAFEQPVYILEAVQQTVGVFQYDAATKELLIKPRYYTITDQAMLQDLPVYLKAGVPSVVYVVTNTGYDNWANDGTDASWQKFKQLEQLKKQTLPTAFPLRSIDKVSIPMAGASEEVEVTTGITVTVPVTRFSCCASAYTTLPAESNRNATNKRK